MSKAVPILAPKLRLPRLHSSLVLREGLIARLDEGFERKLTLLSAPAGFGKTTLVSEWIAARAARQDAPAVAWVSLDAGDNDAVRFWHYVITACQSFDSAVGASALGLLHRARRPSFEVVLTTFINELSQFGGRGVLVLEDYHVITSPQIHETMAFLLDHLPTTLHLIIITRSDPALPLARLRAQDELSELHANDLRFSLEETGAFLQSALPFSFEAAVIARLEARTEGWVAGLRLLALALQGRKDPQELELMLATFTGSHRHILEYFVADVLSAQPEPLQEFLLQTSVLSRLTGSLCDAVTGRNDSERILEQLERANLFLMPLHGAGQWYRYHGLFAEAMQYEARRRLGESSLRALYDKASHWYEEHGMLAEAIEVALSAQDFARTAALIERFVEHQPLNGEMQTLHRWVEQLPEEELRRHPTLCLTDAMVLLYSLDRSAPASRALIERPMLMAEQRWQAEGNRDKLGEVEALRSQIVWWQGDLAQSFRAARKALELLPEEETLWRGTATLAVSIEELLAGRPAMARQEAAEARARFEALGNTFGARAATSVLGEVCLQQGELHRAALLYQQEIDEAAEDPLDMANGLIGLGTLCYEWNELGTAEEQVAGALELGKHHADEVGKYHVEQFLLVPGSLVLARALHARGEMLQAQQLLHELLVLTQERGWLHLQREVLACQAQLSMAGGDLATARRWLHMCAQLDEDFRLVQREREALIRARLLIAQGETGEALELLGRWQAEAYEQGRTRSVLEAQMLSALAHFAAKQLSEARQALRETLMLAQVEGYQRLFLNEGEAMAMLLRSVLPEVKEEPLATYVRTLLLGFARERSGKEVASVPSSPLLIEPLSPQERRVLRLLAAGRSNPEIAQELVVSVNTIKTQVNSIFRKLNVNSRKEAREAARQMKLL